MQIGELRKHYEQEELKREDLHGDPFLQFESWFEEALAAEKGEPNAMVLATAGADATPTSRFVLLKEVDERGFLFFTNFESRKAMDIGENPKASLTFFWDAFIRQVHIRGVVEKLSSTECDEYFASRPRESQLSAWASRQDQIIEDRRVLEDAYLSAETRFEGKDIPRPSYWGGYRVIPTEFEFWQGRPHRLHDRFFYTKELSNWIILRLAP